ncbi:Methyltransferase type 11 [Methanosarcina siciliae C2J]|uniref:Methyltransferase type 11 n=1 Tax=Methanosarcina siciliae C2J TaxID=1434118 RepID=A0A0E3PM42_9EURY|nr:methyltransferase domain-containing protein [Methanosarcina siciliae]AKB36168.1 Methyltransferase type 11 [Methanosarcina siciliae C2J]
MGKWYDLFVSPFEGEFIDTGLHKVQAAPGEVILEIGFGTGQGILKLAQAVGNSGRIYGIDISNKMCEITRLKVEKAGFSKWVQLISGDALSLPFSDSSFN